MQAPSLAIAAPEFLLLLGAVLVAGVVRGFSGFGTAMVFLPIAGRVLDPFTAIIVLVVMDIFGPLPLVPRALRDGRMAEVGWLLAAMAVATPVGLYVLSVADPVFFRWAVSITVLTVLGLLIAGFRHRLPFTPPTLVGTGLVSGILAGVAGLPGPAVVLLYMSSTRAVEVIRANTLVFLVGTDIVLLAVIAAMGAFELSALWIGLALFPPYALAGLLGQRLFDPAREGLYRRVAFAIVAVAAIQGLPIWDQVL